MRIKVKIKPGAPKEKVEKNSDDSFSVWVKARPEKGRANQALMKILAEYLGLPKSKVKITSGLTSRHKTVEILP